MAKSDVFRIVNDLGQETIQNGHTSSLYPVADENVFDHVMSYFWLNHGTAVYSLD